MYSNQHILPSDKMISFMFCRRSTRLILYVLRLHIQTFEVVEPRQRFGAVLSYLLSKNELVPKDCVRSWKTNKCHFYDMYASCDVTTNTFSIHIFSILCVNRFVIATFLLSRIQMFSKWFIVFHTMLTSVCFLPCAVDQY